MTGKRISIALAIASLLFVGAGCTANQDISADLTPTPPVQGGSDLRAALDANSAADVNADVEADAKMKVEAPDSVDGSVDAILKDGSAEMDADTEVEKDADDVDSDKAAANAYGSASYDTDTK